MEEKLNLNKLESKDGALHIKHEEIETRRIDYDNSVALTGSIQAPGNFIEKRKELHKPESVHVLYSYRELYIKMRTEEHQDFLHKSVTGKLIENPAIKEFKINTKSKMSVKDLSELIRFNRFLFADKDENKRVVENLQRFRLAANTEIEAANDNRGNAKDLYEIKSSSNIDLTFDLLMPIYIGQPAKKFQVEILYNVVDRNIQVWLESPQLAELLKVDAISIIDAELKRFPKVFVFIEQ